MKKFLLLTLIFGITITSLTSCDENPQVEKVIGMGEIIKKDSLYCVAVDSMLYPIDYVFVTRITDDGYIANRKVKIRPIKGMQVTVAKCTDSVNAFAGKKNVKQINEYLSYRSDDISFRVFMLYSLAVFFSGIFVAGLRQDEKSEK